MKPLRRSEVKISMPVMLAAGLSTFIVFGLAFGIRLTGEAPPTALLAIGSMLLAPPLVFVGYWFLRDDELEGFRGRELLARCGICAAVFAACWLLFAFVPIYLSGESTLAAVPGSYMLFVIPVMIVIGSFAAVLALELEVIQGVLQYLLYFAITMILALIMGTQLSSSFSGSGGNSPTIAAPPATGDSKTPEAPKTTAPAEEEDKPKINILQ